MALIEIRVFVDARRVPGAATLAMTARAIEELEPGECAEIMATDPATVTIIGSWCLTTGNELVDRTSDGSTYSFVIRRP